MDTAILVSVYNKIDDLMAQLDILSFQKHPIMVVAMHPQTPPLPHTTVRMESQGFYTGPLLSLCAGIRKAKEMDIKYLCYRNADDWLFRHDLADDIFSKMQTEGYKCCAYNWFRKDYFEEFSMNEFFVDVDAFYSTVDKAEEFFKGSSRALLCEWKIPRWIKASIGDWSKFYRVPGRETELGVGHDAGAINYIYNNFKKAPIPDSVWDIYETNNRFFNKDWQLIGSHNNRERYDYWLKIRNDVPYAEELEKKEHFARWLKVVQEDGEWNLPNSEDHIERRIFTPKRMPKKLIIRNR